MQVVILLLLGTGAVISLVGSLWFYAETIREGLVWFLVCLFIPLAGLLFLILHPERALKPAGVIALGTVLSVAGILLNNSFSR